MPPKGIGEVKVTFSPRGYKGKLKKTITVYSNDPANPTISLTVIANVAIPSNWEAPQTSTPATSSF
ncbi:MAG: DUF1573 domain-containing protein [Candidatus Stahlbacteria bacterium]|nr:DUF1573 domain-containing protein [Candidatus Stahlbacteria bacterium]